MDHDTLRRLRSGELVGNAGPAGRITVTYRAPVYVTVNVKTGDVERVYLDDEAVEHSDERWLNADTETIHWPSAQEITTVLGILDGVDWTSTDNRCKVWRGAEGGPANTDEIVDLALRLLLTMAIDHPAPATLGATAGDIKAVRQYLADLDAWNKEHST